MNENTFLLFSPLILVAAWFFGPVLVLPAVAWIRRSPLRVVRLVPLQPGEHAPTEPDLALELDALGFEQVGRFRSDGAQKVFVRYFATRDRLHHAFSIHIDTPVRPHRSYSFCTRFGAAARLHTGTSKLPSTFLYRPGFVGLGVPWKQRAEEVWRLHLAAVEEARKSGFEPTPLDVDRIPEISEADSRENYEDQVRAGFMHRRDPDSWRQTLYGAYRSYFRVFLHMYFKRFFDRIESDATLLARAGERFAAAARGETKPR